MKLSKRCSQEGIGLLDSMIALVVLSVGLLALVQLMGTALNQSAFTQNNTMAAAVAQEKIEELRTVFTRELETRSALADLTDGSHGPQTVTLSSPGNSNMGDKQFRVTWNVDISGKQKTVTGTVEPVVENTRQSESLAFTTVFAP
jgi:type II secretory pathway component PulJ